MRVAHFCKFAPNNAGQYATVKDLVKAEKLVGIDAGFMAVAEHPPMGPQQQPRIMVQPGLQDDWLVSQDPQWAADADIFVRHTIIPKEFEEQGKPIVMLLHGRPENSFNLGWFNKVPIYALIDDENTKNHYKAFVTLWQEFKFHWELLVDKDKLRYVSAPVDLDKYNPDGKAGNFGDHSGSPNIMVADIWREDTSSYNVLHAAAYFKNNYCPEAKIQVFGTPMAPGSPTSHLMGLFHRAGLTGQVHGNTGNIEAAYRAADLLVTPHVIATRIVRESLACGLPIVGGGGNPYTPYNHDPRDTKGYAQAINGCWKAVQDNKKAISAKCRKTAEKHFNLETAGSGMKQVFESVL